jgi:hypothetical protein
MDPPAEYYYDIKKGERVTAGIDIDDSSGISIEKIMKGLQNAKEHNCVIIFYGHRILEHPESGYDTSYGRLEQIFKYVQDNGMKYYRMSDLVSN